MKLFQRAVRLVVAPIGASTGLDVSNPNSDELLGRCTATIPTGNGAKTVNCAAFGAVIAQAIVIPIDKTGNVGFAARGPVSPPGR